MKKNILDDMIKTIEEQKLRVLNVVVSKDGDIIAEHNFEEPRPIHLWSVSKTFTSMAVGIAENAGCFKLSDRVVDHFSADIAYNNIEVNDKLLKMTIHHLLSMSTGHGKCPIEVAIMRDGPFDNITKMFFEEPVVFEPGTHFVYNNGATYMLSKLITLATGYSLKEYLMHHIFMPLEIPEPKWEADPKGISFGCYGLHLTARELSKFGQLLLNKGVFNGQQLIPAEYIEKASKPQVDTAKFDKFFATADHKQGYGYQMWMNSYPNSFRMDGLLGQYVVMLPDKNAVVTYVSNELTNMTGVLELTWKTIIDKL